MKRLLGFAFALLTAFALAGCFQRPLSADERQAAAQESILQEGTSKTGMPAIKNFRERETLKAILEARDKEGLTTYTYIVAQATGKLNLLCESIGFAISDATGYTNPDRIHEKGQYGYAIMPQAEPNGLFTPDASSANWVMCVNPDGKPTPTMIQTDVVVLTYRLP